MEGDYLELSQFPYKPHPFPYNSHQSPLGTTGFLTQWWFLVALNIFFLIVGQAAAVLLRRFNYDQGGNSKWLATLAQTTAAFPILLIPFFLNPSFKEP